MALSGKEFQEIQEALLDGYRNLFDLRQMVRFGLDDSLDAIAGGRNLTEQVFSLVEWADSKGRASDLVRSAYEYNQGNEALKQLYDAWIAPPERESENRPPIVLSPEPQVFLSYSSQDTDSMHRVAKTMREQNISVWISEGLEPGTPGWQAAIEFALRNSECMVVLLSPDAKQSQWVNIEIAVTQRLGRRIFPVLIRGTRDEAVPISLETVQYIDARQEYQPTIENRLVPSVARYLGVAVGAIRGQPVEVPHLGMPVAPDTERATQRLASQPVPMEDEMVTDGEKRRRRAGPILVVVGIALALLTGIVLWRTGIIGGEPPKPPSEGTPVSTVDSGTADSLAVVALPETDTPTRLPPTVTSTATAQPTKTRTSTPDRAATQAAAATSFAATETAKPTPTPTDAPTPTATATDTATPKPTPIFSPIPGPTSTPKAGDVRPIGGIPFVYVPAGEFTMGSNDGDELARYNEKPQHTVYVDAFWIMQTEVTNEQYGACFEAGDCRAPDNERWDDAGYADHPVVDVSWDDAVSFVGWLSDEMGRVMYLPTEAEWEKACRGIDGRIYPWGDASPNNNLLNYPANLFEVFWGNTTEVGTYSPQGDSPYGLADMAGNVREWTAARGPEDGVFRTLRGGSWMNGGGAVRCAHRYYDNPGHRLNDYGFRVVSPRSVSELEEITAIVEATAAELPTEIPDSMPTPTSTATPSPTPTPTESEPPATLAAGTMREFSSIPFVYVPEGEFWIMQTEVTNEMYQRFIDAGGYNEENRGVYWSDEGWQWRTENAITEPRFWDDSQFNQDKQPVVGVSWYEANAFANWLREESGRRMRLPTDAEWETACAGTDGRKYPWGDVPAPSESLLNYISNVGFTTEVGSYPEGATPYGVLDMAGNAWEWTEEFSLLGGSWNPSERYVRCAADLSRFTPGSWGNYSGFRVVRQETARED